MIDTDFDFRTDTPEGKDPDRHSATLRGHHKLLWSKPLPNGQVFDLDDTTSGCYLHHKSGLGEFSLSSDSVVPTYRGWTRPDVARIVGQTPEADVNSFQGLGYTIGGMMVFPSNRVDGGWTLNQARGLDSKIADRLDLTLECIRREYLGESSPLGDVLRRYQDFFNLFGNFREYVDFFLLQDLTSPDYAAVTFFLPFEDFRTPALPQDVEHYATYRLRSSGFVRARNNRIAESR